MAAINPSPPEPDHELERNPIFMRGYAPFAVGDETYQICYWIAGDLKNSKETPLVVAHGGPGRDCENLGAHADLTTKDGIPVILYDQIGAGFSTHLPHKKCDFWTPDLICDQLAQLLDHLGINDKFDFLGHSWGGILGAYFAGSRKPPGLRRLIIVGSPVSFPLVDKSIMDWVRQFPEKCRIAVEKAESGEEYNEEDLKEASRLWLVRHTCRIEPTPEVLLRRSARAAKDPSCRICMIGENFTTAGSLKDFSLIDILHNITATTLIINGEYDMCQDFCVKDFLYLIPRSKWVRFNNCSHMPFLEDRERYIRVVSDFLKA